LARLTPLVLGPKEALSLTNGPAFSAGLAALAVEDAGDLLGASILASALCFAAQYGARSALHPSLHAARPHRGQRRIAGDIRRWLRGCAWLDRQPSVQDPYSLRCAPQILGPVWEAITVSRLVVTREINSSTDNPLLLARRAISGGNFHGAPLALAADYLKIALVQPASLAERQVDQLVAGSARSGLPPMLVADAKQAGLQSGLMMLQYTAAALVLESQGLAQPDSVHSIPTSAGQEDLNPNAATAARHLRHQVDILRKVLAIELVAVTRAIQIRRHSGERAPLGASLESAFRILNRAVNLGEADQPLYPAIERVEQLLRSGARLHQLRPAD
jgi:histidine ammonia-lyase